jgi:hypothetical protein
MKSLAKVILIAGLTAILNGCFYMPRKAEVLTSPKIPSSLASEINYIDLKGHYYKVIADSVCREELKLRAIDVVNLITTVNNTNAKLKAIRNINSEN